MRFDIRYRCRFTYDALVRESQNELRACPASDEHQTTTRYRVQTAPSARVLSFTDWWGTRVDAFGVREPHLVLDVLAEATVETRPRPLLSSDPRTEALDDPVFRDTNIDLLGPSAHTAAGAAINEAAHRQADFAGRGVVSRVLALHRFVGSHLSYVTGSTYVGVEIDEVFARGRGVCQDFAHLGVAMCRAVGIPARYVSGYLFTVDESRAADPDDDVEAVRVQTHAWFEAAIPGFGWLGLDPTNGLEVGQRHVKIGHGRDYDDVPPLRGLFAGRAGHQLDVVVDITRLGTPLPHAVPALVPDARRLVQAGEEAALRRFESDRSQQHQPNAAELAQQQQQQQ